MMIGNKIIYGNAEITIGKSARATFASVYGIGTTISKKLVDVLKLNANARSLLPPRGTPDLYRLFSADRFSKHLRTIEISEYKIQ